MRDRIVSIEAFRFIFMVVLCLFHFSEYVTIYHGYLVVEFFFVLSGVLLYNSIRQNENIGTLGFAIKRYKRLWIEYSIAATFSFFALSRSKMISLNIDDLLNFILSYLSELLLLPSGILFPRYVNGPSWYISILLIVSFVLYPFLKKYRQQTLTMFLPSIFILCLLLVFSNAHLYACGDIWSLFRGFADISLGIMLGHFLYVKKDFLKNSTFIINTLSLISLLFILLLIFSKHSDENDVYIFIFLPVFIIGLFYEGTLYNKYLNTTIWRTLGGISYSMLLIHYFVRGLLVYFNIGNYMGNIAMILCYLFLVIVLSFCLKMMADKLRLLLGW